ncbi:hypothetical protein KAFR_0I01170 [Kazachstania africana CBS 2517]|uniref:Endopolyphosphatase n=1 Tax=Kazachstania africana (strain ATCC 22294 / BCRC 22015 / CBS 2517 / CECT 1963 / NBRC 1671 / NRRL Y-8276) TaxID=1071382 RepID=H2AZU8_KAZAF|nr:hypothetical protein KAFR_0I01170 [Kazachstania africana CBS 2517]CCF59898.1 hypothetical protein KAFR_0I01170 [Kazachstania africana CBS 2517]
MENNLMGGSVSRPIIRNKGLLCLTLAVILTFSCVFTYHSTFKQAASQPISSMHRNATSKMTSYEDDLARLRLKYQAPVSIYDPYLGRNRTLYGRFLHITDIHPDRHYGENNSISRLCHYPPAQSSIFGSGDNDVDDLAPRFGKAMAGCDSPMDLIDYTLKWVRENLRDKIDFVIWTGDNIRHDNDRSIPRTESRIFEMNEIVSGKFHDLFSKHDSDDPRNLDVAVIPSLGNNDVFPHNLFSLGPTLQTRELYKIWDDFIPQEQQRTFDRVASFVKEVIPGKLAVISINTLYLFKSNPLVDNCNGRKQPGYQLLIWLGYVLQEIRERGMKVWISGHVPPIQKNMDDSCYNKFSAWTYEYRDIIIGGVYGHMNLDHFIPVDGKKSKKRIEKYSTDADIPVLLKTEEGHNTEVSAFEKLLNDIHLEGAQPVNKEAYMDDVRETIYNKVRKKLGSIDDITAKRKTKDDIYERYSIVHIAGSVVPTFNPSFRVWEYNITDLVDDVKAREIRPWNEFFRSLETELFEDSGNGVDIFSLDRNKNDKTTPPKKPKDLPLGPAYIPQLFTPTSFVQYYADLESINEHYLKEVSDGVAPDEAADSVFHYDVEYTSVDEGFDSKSLLVGDYLEFAAKLSKKEKLWGAYKKRAFISSGYKDE